MIDAILEQRRKLREGFKLSKRGVVLTIVAATLVTSVTAWGFMVDITTQTLQFFIGKAHITVTEFEDINDTTVGGKPMKTSVFTNDGEISCYLRAMCVSMTTEEENTVDFVREPALWSEPDAEGWCYYKNELAPGDFATIKYALDEGDLLPDVDRVPYTDVYVFAECVQSKNQASSKAAFESLSAEPLALEGAMIPLNSEVGFTPLNPDNYQNPIERIEAWLEA